MTPLPMKCNDNEIDSMIVYTKFADKLVCVCACVCVYSEWVCVSY